MSNRSLEKAYEDKDLAKFKKILKNMTPQQLEKDYVPSPAASEGFNFGTALSSVVVHGTFGGDHDFIQALLQAGADPNYISPMTRTSALGILFDPRVTKKMLYAEYSTFNDNLDQTIEMLLDYGVDYEDYLKKYPNSEVSHSIERSLARGAGRIDALRLNPKKLHYVWENLCKDLSNGNGMIELRAMARKLGLAQYSKLRKNDLCAVLATQILSHQKGLMPLIR